MNVRKASAAGVLGAIAWLASTQGMAQPQLEGQASQEMEVPAAPYFAGLTALANRDRKLPALDYWGVGTAVWGTVRAEAAREPMVAASETCEIASRKCTTTTRYDADQRLETVTYSFAQGTKDRNERLAIFLELQGALQAEYGTASVSFAPVENVRGQDAFVQGLDQRYELKWLGPETDATLTLTADQLIIELSRAKKGNARQLETDFSAFEGIRATLPKNHPLNTLLPTIKQR